MGADNNTTYSPATQSANGLMTAADKKKLDGIADKANNYALPAATNSVRGGVKTGYAANGKNYPVQLSNEQMFVNVPWTDTNTTYGAVTQSANGLMIAADKKKLDHIVSGNQNMETHDANATAVNGMLWYASNGPATSLGATVDNGALYTQVHSANWQAQIAQDYRNGRMFVRGKNNGTWTAWKRIANFEELPVIPASLPANGGNASTADKLKTARKINGVAFDGSKDITIADNTKLPLAGGNMTGTINTGVGNTSWINSNKGTAIINSTAQGGGWNPLAKLNSADGVFTHGTYQKAYYLNYTNNATITNGTNTNTKQAILLNESGDSSFPGTVVATKFQGALVGNADTATKATQDSAGQQIHSTYIKGLSINGKVITYTKGDNTTGTITTQDNNTTYSPATQSANGLMTAADKKKLDGIAAGANAYTLPLATASVRGGAKIGYTANGKNYPVQLSNEQMFVNVPWTDTNTTYSAMKGASASADGAAGLVPAPAKGNQGKYLRADGTWQTPPDTNTVYTHPTTSGHKHIPAGGASGQILRWSADGTAVWGNDNNTTYSNMGAASASAAGKAGLVPAPAAGAQGKFLRGDGTWQTPANTTYSVATQSANGLMSAADKKKLDGMSGGANNIKIGSVTVVEKTGGTFKITNSGSYTKCFLMFFKGTDEFYAFGTVDFKAPSGSMITIENICMKNPVSLQVQSRSSSEITLYAYQTISTSTDTVNLTYMAILF